VKYQIIGFTIGILLVIVGVAELIPALLDFKDGHLNASDFLVCSVVSIFFGGSLILANRNHKSKLNLKQTFMLTTLSWALMSLFAALPLYFSDMDFTFTDAAFEAVSGITTTGSTVINGLDDMSRGVLLWRSIMQWIGGIGIIAFAIVILPFLRIGGMQLFHTESSDQSEKTMPKTLNLVTSILIIYVALTIICAVLYNAFGMTVFNAINHAMTTVPTGGFSTHDASFGHYDSAALQYIASLFMILGSIPFVLFVKFVFQGKFEFFKDEQLKVYLSILFGLICLLSIWLWWNSAYSLSQSIQYSVFNIVSVITTTGYATIDYTAWGVFAVAFFLFITYIGACSGSTSGGIKIMRLIVATKLINWQVKRLTFPSAMFSMRYQRRVMPPSLAMDVMSFMGLYVAANVILAVALALLGLDFETAISGAATALANVGPGIGDTIGPSGNFSSLPDTAKWLLSAGMILGRLEIMTICVLFTRSYWRG